MPKGSTNLAGMTVEALLKLRDDIGTMLTTKTHELRRQLERLEGPSAGKGKRGGRRAHPTKGSKLAAKYRGPDGETWAGRGARPRWLQGLLKQGHSLDEFYVGEPSAASEAAEVESGKSRKRRSAGRRTRAAA